MSESASRAPFPTTRWSRVARAGDPAAPEAKAALAELCAAYWYPIYALIRRAGHDAHDAVDLTQDFFDRLLERATLGTAGASPGRVRAVLRTDYRSTTVRVTYHPSPKEDDEPRKHLPGRHPPRTTRRAPRP